RLENWSDYIDDKDYYPDFASKGYRLLIREDVLSAFLSASQLNLILECEVRKKDGSEEIDTYYNPSVKLYLLKDNGSKETIRDIGLPEMDMIRRFDEEDVREPLERWKAIDETLQ